MHYFIDLTCNPEKQTQFYIIPRCCIYAAHHLVKVLDHASSVAGFHYELNSGKILFLYKFISKILFYYLSHFYERTGSLLGAVKLHNFIPWDIDGDVYIPTEHMHYFHENGIARFILESEGIKIFR